MIRGTTPTLTFKLPFQTSRVDDVYITFNQANITVLEKTKNDTDLHDDIVELKLTQADTLSLNRRPNVEIQLRVLTTDGEALASQIIVQSVSRILKDGVI